MKAGRELDAHIAEVVFKATHSGIGTAEWMHFTTQGPYEDCDCSGHIEAMVCPHYSTSLTAAWKVVEAVKHYIGDDLFMRWDARDNAWWVGRVGCGDAGGEEFAHRVSAPTLPLALCLAVLEERKSYERSQ